MGGGVRESLEVGVPGVELVSLGIACDRAQREQGVGPGNGAVGFDVDDDVAFARGNGSHGVGFSGMVVGAAIGLRVTQGTARPSLTVQGWRSAPLPRQPGRHRARQGAYRPCCVRLGGRAAAPGDRLPAVLVRTWASSR